MIQKKDLKIGHAYKVHARNFEYAIWDGYSMQGLRTKFRDTFMFGEQLEEDGGTCIPLKELDA